MFETIAAIIMSLWVSITPVKGIDIGGPMALICFEHETYSRTHVCATVYVYDNNNEELDEVNEVKIEWEI